MKKTMIAALTLSALFAGSAAAYTQFDDDNDMEFKRNIVKVRGLKVTQDEGYLNLKGEGYNGGKKAQFELFANTEDSHEVHFSTTEASDNMTEYMTEVTYEVDGKVVSHNTGVTLTRGIYDVGANLDRPAHEIDTGEAEVTTVITLR